MLFPHWSKYHTRTGQSLHSFCFKTVCKGGGGEKVATARPFSSSSNACASISPKPLTFSKPAKFLRTFVPLFSSTVRYFHLFETVSYPVRFSFLDIHRTVLHVHFPVLPYIPPYGSATRIGHSARPYSQRATIPIGSCSFSPSRVYKLDNPQPEKTLSHPTLQHRTVFHNRTVLLFQVPYGTSVAEYSTYRTVLSSVAFVLSTVRYSKQTVRYSLFQVPYGIQACYPSLLRN